MRAFLKGFTYAFSGIINCFKNQRNFRFHIVFGAFVLWFSRFFCLNRAEYALLFLTMGFVICAEAVNSAIEYTVDLITLEHHPLAKSAKDAAAGGVLISAVASVAVGIAIFAKGEGFIRILNYFSDNPLKILILLLFIITGTALVFFYPKKTEHK